MCGDDVSRITGCVRGVERVVGQSLQLGQFLVEAVERDGSVAVGVAGPRPGAQQGPANVVETVGASAAPALGAQSVQHMAAVVV